MFSTAAGSLSEGVAINLVGLQGGRGPYRLRGQRDIDDHHTGDQSWRLVWSAGQSALGELDMDICTLCTWAEHEMRLLMKKETVAFNHCATAPRQHRYSFGWSPCVLLLS